MLAGRSPQDVWCDGLDPAVRPLWNGVGERTRFLIARSCCTNATGLWTIYRRPRNPEFHEYKRRKPTTNVQVLLEQIETSGDPDLLLRAVTGGGRLRHGQASCHLRNLPTTLPAPSGDRRGQIASRTSQLSPAQLAVDAACSER